MLNGSPALVDEKPALWNPSAAAAWSLLLSPAFGSWLHSQNWKSLGNAEHSRGLKRWMLFWLGVLTAQPVLEVLYGEASGVLQIASVPVFLYWYFRSVRPQVRLVRGLGGYKKNGFGRPLLVAVGLLVCYLVLAAVLGAVIATGT